MIRFVTFKEFIEKARFKDLDGIVSSSRVDIDAAVTDWKRKIGFNDLPKVSQELLTAVTDSCVDVDWDYSAQMKSWLDQDRRGLSVQEIEDYCVNNESTHELLYRMRKELNSSVSGFAGSVLNREKDFSPWVEFHTRFDFEELPDFIISNDLSELMGECCYHLQSVQNYHKAKRICEEAIIDSRIEQMIENEEWILG